MGCGSGHCGRRRAWVPGFRKHQATRPWCPFEQKIRGFSEAGPLWAEARREPALPRCASFLVAVITDEPHAGWPTATEMYFLMVLGLDICSQGVSSSRSLRRLEGGSLLACQSAVAAGHLALVAVALRSLPLSARGLLCLCVFLSSVS